MKFFLFYLLHLLFRKFFNENTPSLRIADIKNYLNDTNPVILLKWAFQFLLVFATAHFVEFIVDSAGISGLTTPEGLVFLSKFVIVILVLEAIARICIWMINKICQTLNLH